MVDGAQHRDGLGADLADRDDALRLPLFLLRLDLLIASEASQSEGPRCRRGPFLLRAASLWFGSTRPKLRGTAHDRRTTEALRLGPRRRRHVRGRTQLRARPLSR